jgi:putative serine/threonine protein kinase
VASINFLWLVKGGTKHPIKFIIYKSYCCQRRRTSKMSTPVIVPIEELSVKRYASIICYPRPTKEEIINRIEELKHLGVKAVEFFGEASAFNVPVLGKGYVGIVVVAHVDNKRFALKMLRVDTGRQSLQREAELLAKANSVKVGPILRDVSKNFLLMKLIDGKLVKNWLETRREPETVRKVMADIFEQCWRLDEIGLDHGELSKAPKHLLVEKTNEPFIVDFEAASLERNVANVTAVCQFLFMGKSSVAQALTKTLGEINRADLISVLRSYKKNRNRQNFKAITQLAIDNKHN